MCQMRSLVGILYGFGVKTPTKRLKMTGKVYMVLCERARPAGIEPTYPYFGWPADSSAGTFGNSLRGNLLTLPVVLCSFLSYAHVGEEKRSPFFFFLLTIRVNPHNCEEIQTRNYPQAVDKYVSNPN